MEKSSLFSFFFLKKIFFYLANMAKPTWHFPKLIKLKKKKKKKKKKEREKSKSPQKESSLPYLIQEKPNTNK